MKDRREESADFGRDDVEIEDEIEDEIVPDELPEEEEPLEEDELEDSEDDDSDDDDSSKPEPKKRDKAQTRINQIQREKYRAIHQAEKATSEAERWRQKYELMKQMTTRFYDVDVNSRIERAQSAHKLATESGDAEAQTAAIAELTAAQVELQNLNQVKYQDEYERSTRPQQIQQPVEAPDNEIVGEWLQDNHEWINPQSKRYDKELAAFVVDIDRQLSEGLAKIGMQGKIGNSDYFHELDKHKEEFLANRRSPNQNRELNMRQSRGGASPVRNSGQSQNRSQRQEYKLSADERELARASGVDEDKFIKEKIKFMREESLNGGRR